MSLFSDRVIEFNRQLNFSGTLPPGISLLNPYAGSEAIRQLVAAFYEKFYHDNRPRRCILGINPGRLGAGFTGIPFTDTRRLREKCGIDYTGAETHEPSSVFVYSMIEAFGGPEAFYQRYYIGSVCPLGFTATGKNGREVNYNYYDSRELTLSVADFIVQSIRKQIAMGLETSVCYCFGTGKNEAYLRRINDQEHLFDRIVALEHPRYIMQYKARSIDYFIARYLEAFNTL